MGLLSVMGATGCAGEKEGDSEKILRFLAEKYGDEFMIHSIRQYRETMVDAWEIRAICSSNTYPLKRFDVQADVKLKFVHDGYDGVLVGAKCEEQIKEVADKYFNGSQVYAAIDIGTVNQRYEAKMSPQEYFEIETLFSAIFIIMLDESDNKAEDLNEENLTSFAEDMRLLYERASIDILSLSGISYEEVVNMYIDGSIKEYVQFRTTDSRVNKNPHIVIREGEIRALIENDHD